VFGLKKRNSVESMLKRLSEVGIGLRPGIRVDRLFLEWPRSEVEKNGYELLLAAMGDLQYDHRTFVPLEPLSDDIWHFDAEAIEDDGDYAQIVENCRRIATGELVFQDFSDHVDIENGLAWVELMTAAGTERIDLKVDNDWVDPKIFHVMQAKLDAAGSRRLFAAHVMGQDSLVICQPASNINRINDMTGLQFSNCL
jgi:hypothetical protein